RKQARHTAQPRQGRQTGPDLSPLPGLEDSVAAIPVVPPPANFRCASGAIMCVDTNALAAWRLTLAAIVAAKVNLHAASAALGHPLCNTEGESWLTISNTMYS